MNFIITPLCNIRLISEEKFLNKSLSKSDKTNSVINKLFKFVAVIFLSPRKYANYLCSCCFLREITLFKRKLKYILYLLYLLYILSYTYYTYRKAVLYLHLSLSYISNEDY